MTRKGGGGGIPPVTGNFEFTTVARADVTIPTTGSGYNCTIDWGDGSTPTNHSGTPGNIFHSFIDGSGEHQIIISGTFPRIYYNSGAYRLQIKSVENFGDVGWTTFIDAFSGCFDLETIAGGMKCTASSQAFARTFKDCISLTSIPSGLFDESINASSEAFNGTFDNCETITNIPSGLFDYNVNASSFAFFTTFIDCDNLVSIPSGLFDNNILVSTFGFQQTFDNCRNLTTVPDGLFANNTVCTNFRNCFVDCNKLQINPLTFYAQANRDTRFLNQSVDFRDCFKRAAFTGTQGTAPDLWDANYGTGTPNSTGCYGGVGNDGTSISNYASIPVGWL
jgi:hypothetical protein